MLKANFRLFFYKLIAPVIVTGVLFWSSASAQTVGRYFKPDSVRNTSQDSSRFAFSQLEAKASKNYITRKLFGLFVNKRSLNKEEKILITQKATDKYDVYNGLTVANVTITILPPFGYNVYDTLETDRARIEQIANRLHVKTQRSAIRRSFLIEEGEPIQSYLIVESEDLLRKLNYIDDVIIVINPIENTSAANVSIIVKDKWSIGANVYANSAHEGNIEFFEKNLAGTGIETKGILYVNSKHEEKFGHEMNIAARNPLGYRFYTSFKIRDGLDYSNRGATIEKNFTTSNTLWAGGIAINRNREPFYIHFRDQSQFISYRNNWTWIGASVNIDGQPNRAPHQLSVTTSWENRTFFSRPSTSVDSNYFFQNTNLYLAGIAFSNNQYLRDNHVYRFGPTEDLPIGFLTQLTLGYEHGEYSDRPYLGVDFKGGTSWSIGYSNAEIKLGSFIGNNGFEQAAIQLRVSHFNKLFRANHWLFRHFLYTNYTRGMNRKYGEGDYLVFANEILGRQLPTVVGFERLNARSQLVAFSPLTVYGFKFAFNGFVDFLGLRTQNALEQKNYALGIGGGIKIKNDNLVFQTFIIQLSYYPIFPKEAPLELLKIGGDSNGMLYDFRPVRPTTIQYY